MARTTRLLHGEETPVLSDVFALPRGESTVLLSRFVASYVFPNSDALLEWVIANFDALAIEDPFTVDGSEWSGRNHGQPETFFSLPHVVDGLLSKDFRVGLISAYGDWPAGTARCHVIKLVATRRDTEWNAMVTGLQQVSQCRIEEVESGESLLHRLNSSLADGDWERVRQAKASSPVWGPTSPDYQPLSPRDERRSKRALGPWGNYGLSGPMAVDAISKALQPRATEE